MLLVGRVCRALGPLAGGGSVKVLALAQINGGKRLAIHFHGSCFHLLDRTDAERPQIGSLDLNGAVGLVGINRRPLTVARELLHCQPMVPVMTEFVADVAHMSGIALLFWLGEPVIALFD